MDLQLNGKSALITGGSKGIGLATAECLLAEGCRVILVARGRGDLDAAKAQLATKGYDGVTVLVADLASEDGVSAVGRYDGTVDILVNNAGSIPPGDLRSVDSDRWRQAWDLKVFGYIDLCRLLYPRLAERGGVIVNIIGAGGETLPPDYIAGATGNAALMAFTRALGRGSPKDGVRVVGINPGAVGTARLEMLMRAAARAKLGDEDRWRDLVADMPFGRFAEPTEIANAVAFLASPRSGYTTGTILSVSGGI